MKNPQITATHIIKKETFILLGYVLYIKYNSEGNFIEWLLSKTDLCKRLESPKIYKTIELAEKAKKTRQKNYAETIHIRKYYLTKFI